MDIFCIDINFVSKGWKMKKKFFLKRKKKEKLSQNTLKPSPQPSKKKFKKIYVFFVT